MKILAIGDFQGKFPNNLKRRIKKEDFDLVVGVGDYGGIDDWRPYILAFFKSYEKYGKRISPEEYFGKKGFKSLLRRDRKATECVLRDLNGIGKRVIYVFGNGDDEWYSYPFQRGFWKVMKSKKGFLRKLENLKNITYSQKKVKGKVFFGFGGYWDLKWYSKEKKNRAKNYGRKVKTRIRRSRRDLFDRLRKLNKKDRKIFVFHYPPKGVFDIIKERGNPYNGKSSGIEAFTEAIKRYSPELVLCGHMHEYQGARKIGKSLVVNPGDAEKGKAAIIDIPEEKGKKIKVKFIK
jgi:Icc-related predicted phosphoesterase